MEWTIPGTVLQIRREDADGVEERFSSMFLAGGMVLSQVASITGLEPYTIQNWVKRGFLPPPEHRKYSMGQLCRILNINMLKNTLSMETICGLLGYINGKLDETADDIIDDAQLYFLFVRLAARAKQLEEPEAWKRAMDDALRDYLEPVPGARERIEKTLQIMLVAWLAARARQRAEQMLREL
jgi:DNA-binding transcriptional MerR regulator